MTLRLAIFDVDGTLVDSQNVIVAAMTAAFTSVGVDAPPRAAILSIVGLSLPVAMARLAPGATPAAQDALVSGYRDAFVAARAAGQAEAAAPLYDGIRGVLDGLRQRDMLLLGVATGKARRGFDHLAQAHGLAGYFQTIQTADHHPSKPHPAMLHTALSETGVDAAHALMIGDTTFDMDMGRAAGLHTIGVTWGYHPPEALRAAGADLLVHAPGDLTEAIDTIWDAVE